MALIMNKEAIAERRFNNQEVIKGGLYKGRGKENIENKNPELLQIADKETGKIITFNNSVDMKTKVWQDSHNYNKLWNRIDELKTKMNSGTNPFSATEYYELVDLLRIDISKRRMQEQDYTNLITAEITNPAFSKSVNLDEFLDYAGIFEEMTLNGDTVPLLQQKFGATDSVTMKHHGLGHSRTLLDELYNTDIYELEKVNRAVTRAHIGKRNNLSIGLLPALTTAVGWDAAQKVAADATGTSPEDKLYITLNKGIETLMNLLDSQTKQEIDVPRMVLVCRPTDTRRINRAIRGRLQVGEDVVNRDPLDEIAELWPYRGDVVYWGEKKITYPGVAENKAYLLVPGSSGAPWWTLSKRQLTEEVGAGDVFQFGREKRAWYWGQTTYNQEFFGGSGGLTAGTGYVIEITLPAV